MLRDGAGEMVMRGGGIGVQIANRDESARNACFHIDLDQLTLQGEAVDL
jgi:hypothetical protein